MSLLDRRRFRRDGSGFLTRIPEAEQSLLVHLPSQLSDTLDGVEATEPVPDDIVRLFPRAHTIDDDAEAVYESAHRAELLDHFRDALEVLGRTAGSRHISDEEAEAWLAGLNALRLVLGSRLGVTEEAHELLESDPAYGDWICYHYLSYLQNELVEAMTGALPPPRPGIGDDLPEDPWGEPLGGLRWDGTPMPGEPPPP